MISTVIQRLNFGRLVGEYKILYAKQNSGFATTTRVTCTPTLNRTDGYGICTFLVTKEAVLSSYSVANSGRWSVFLIHRHEPICRGQTGGAMELNLDC